MSGSQSNGLTCFETRLLFAKQIRNSIGAVQFGTPCGPSGHCSACHFTIGSEKRMPLESMPDMDGRKNGGFWAKIMSIFRFCFWIECAWKEEEGGKSLVFVFSHMKVRTFLRPGICHEYPSRKDWEVKSQVRRKTQDKWLINFEKIIWLSEIWSLSEPISLQGRWHFRPRSVSGIEGAVHWHPNHD